MPLQQALTIEPPASLSKYDRTNWVRAMTAVQDIERVEGRDLAAHDIRAAHDYAIDVFGSVAYAPWLCVYTIFGNAGFREGWIPENYFGSVVSPKLNSSARFVSRTKTLSRRILRTDTLPDVAYSIDGVYYDIDMQPVAWGAFLRLLAEHPRLIAKGDNSHSGKAIATFTAKDATPELFAGVGNCVIQRFVWQHEFLAELSPTAVGTLRVMTVRTPDHGTRIPAAHLRLGRTDKEWVTTGKIRVAVDIESGKLDGRGVLDDWTTLSAHPDTGVPFEESTMPYFTEALELCEQLHERVPQFGVIGWDLTIDPDGHPILLEWNAVHPGLSFGECTTGPNFVGYGWEQLRA